MSLEDLCRKFTSSEELKILSRPYFNHSVSFKKSVSKEERLEAMEKAGLNVFFYPSDFVTGCDLLSDSGTTTMTDKQWAALHLGDETYGSNKGYFKLAETIRTIFGSDFFVLEGRGQNAFLFHQGRSAEHALFSQVGKLGKDLVIPSNGYFDTTFANAEVNGILPLNLHTPELKDEKSKSHFKGDMDIARLEDLLKEKNELVPLVYLTITNNPGGGQPVSMANIKAVFEISHKFKIPIFFDACRFAENAWFIKKYEDGYQDKTIEQIILEMFDYADGFTISFKKDGLANMGGGLFIKSNGFFERKYPHIAPKITDHQILIEGNPTYGGMSGRDIMALDEGLKTVTKMKYLTHRIDQVKQFGENMLSQGLPVLEPIGGHAVYLDMNRFFVDTDLSRSDFGGISFTALLLSLYGHRACELGDFAFGSYDPLTKQETQAEVNFVRFAVPRLRYEQSDLDSVVEATKSLYDHRHEIPPVEVIYGQELPLRHFKAQFKFKI